MKIIKEGKNLITAVRQTCTYCDCEFEYEKKDVQYDQRDMFPYVTCPW